MYLTEINIANKLSFKKEDGSSLVLDVTHLGLDLENFNHEDIKISSSSPVFQLDKYQFMQRYQILMFARDLHIIQIAEIEYIWDLPQNYVFLKK